MWRQTHADIEHLGPTPVSQLLFVLAASVRPGKRMQLSDEQQSLQKQIARLQQEIKDANDRNAAKLKELQEQVDSLKQKAAEANEPAAVPEPNQTSEPSQGR